jgi:hypothetical protein
VPEYKLKQKLVISPYPVGVFLFQFRMAKAGLSKIARNVFAIFFIMGLSLGSFFWADDAWPFAPMRQFAWSPKDYVWSLALDAELADGTTVRIPYERFHLRRAEAEGQLNRLRSNPRMLRDLMVDYNAEVPAPRRIVSLTAVKRKTPVVDGRPVRTGAEVTSRDSRGPPAGLVTTLEVIAKWPPASHQ